MITLNQKTLKTTPSRSLSPSSHSSHKPWLVQPQQEPQASFSHQSALVDKAQKKELAKVVVEEAVEEIVVAEVVVEVAKVMEEAVEEEAEAEEVAI